MQDFTKDFSLVISSVSWDFKMNLNLSRSEYLSKSTKISCNDWNRICLGKWKVDSLSGNEFRLREYCIRYRFFLPKVILWAFYVFPFQSPNYEHLYVTL